MEADVVAVEPEAAVDGPLVFTFEGAECVGQRSQIIDKQAMADAGLESNSDFTMEVRTSQFVAPRRPPASQDIIQIGDVNYRIASVTPDQYGIVNHYAVKEDSN